MSEKIVIALDAMGGDEAPYIVIKGVDLVRVRFPDVRFLLFGDKSRLDPILEQFPAARDVCEVRHTDEAVKSADKPSQALRKGRQSSMRLAIDAVRDGEAGGVVSAGNTGALMAMAKFSLKTLPSINRPAIASLLPSEKGETVMLDLGANVECDAENLVQFAVMGADFARTVLGRTQPRVGLLNVGSEELKGNSTVKFAGDWLKSIENPPFDYCGFVEGDDITKGVVDVVVTDGFTGNVALKTAEGVVKLYSSFLRAGFKTSWLSKLGYLLASGGLNVMKERLDPRRYNGGPFLGVNGVCVKSHGGTDAFGFSSAIAVAIEMVSEKMIEEINEHFKNFDMAAKLASRNDKNAEEPAGGDARESEKPPSKKAAE